MEVGLFGSDDELGVVVFYDFLGSELWYWVGEVEVDERMLFVDFFC